ncbi:MAG: stage V sporulation protein S [Chloroflexia bacterium]|nr:stage V sporulation protein S [Chloroflexia bacterium]
MEILFSNLDNEELEDITQPEPEEEIPEDEAQPEVVELEEEEAEEGETTPTRPSILKVSSRSRPSAVAGAVAGVIRESDRAELQSIGAGATNQAVKAVAIASSYLEEDGIEIICMPSFVEVLIDGEERTAIRLVVERRD